MKKWVKLAAESADQSLGENTEVFFVGEVLGITDWFIVTSGNNARQVKTICNEVEKALTIADGPKPKRIEGKSSSGWVLMDYGPFVVHIFTAEAREFYDIERLWTDVPRMEIASSLKDMSTPAEQ